MDFGVMGVNCQEANLGFAGLTKGSCWGVEGAAWGCGASPTWEDLGQHWNLYFSPMKWGRGLMVTGVLPHLEIRGVCHPEGTKAVLVRLFFFLTEGGVMVYKCRLFQLIFHLELGAWSL